MVSKQQSHRAGMFVLLLLKVVFAGLLRVGTGQAVTVSSVVKSDCGLCTI